jgi:transcriptional regulator with XRE-family HTH domain
MIVDQPPGPAQQVLAANLRRLRIARHLSLSQLGRATGISKATLSGIEHGRSNPTIETLVSLAAALGVALGDLIEELPLGEIRITRAAQSRPQERDGVRQRALDSLALTGRLELTEIALEPRHLHEVAAKPAGSRGHVYVIQGKLIAGPVERITELAPGDYASFPTDAPHVYEAGQDPARALLITQAAD